MGGQYFKYTIAQFQNGDIKCSSTKVIYRNLLVSGSFVQTISQSCSSWFVNNSAHLQTRNLSGLFGSLTLGVIKIRRYSNDGFVYILAQVILSRFLHFLKDHS